MVNPLILRNKTGGVLGHGMKIFLIIAGAEASAKH
jgi:hypothetical protein